MLTLRTIKQVNSAFPTQWEGETVDGRGVFILYRYGCLKVYASEPGGCRTKAMEAYPLYDDYVGDALDGVLSLEDMLEHTGITILTSREERSDE